MEEGTKNRLWSALYTYYFKDWMEYEARYHYNDIYNDSALPSLLWLSYFKFPIDRLPRDAHSFVENVVRKHFFSCEWYEILDLVEAVLRVSHDTPQINKEFTDYCNYILESELYGYRIVSERFVENTSKGQIVEIEDAIEGAPNQVSAHLARSLELFSDRQNPDYRNSIKESISAVEALCCQIASKPNFTLGKAVDEIKKQGKVRLHPALWEAIKNLYGMSSDVPGIRHGKPGESSVGQEDARFMLVTCSAIVNFLIVKADKAGIDLRQ